MFSRFLGRITPPKWPRISRLFGIWNAFLQDTFPKTLARHFSKKDKVCASLQRTYMILHTFLPITHSRCEQQEEVAFFFKKGISFPLRKSIFFKNNITDMSFSGFPLSVFIPFSAPTKWTEFLQDVQTARRSMIEKERSGIMGI